MRVDTQFLILILLGCGILPPVTAQVGPAPGDYILAGNTLQTGQLLLARPGGGGQVTTLFQFAPNQMRLSGVGMFEDNRSLGIVAQQLNPTTVGLLLKYQHGAIPPITTLTSLAAGSLPADPTSFCWDARGRVTISNSRQHLFQYDLSFPGQFTTFYTHASPTSYLKSVQHVPLHDYVVLGISGAPPFLFCVDEVGKFSRTLDTLHLQNAQSVSHDTGAFPFRFLATRWPGRDIVALEAGSGKLTTLTTLVATPYAHRHTQRNSIVVLGTGFILQEIDMAGKIVKTLQLKTPPSYIPTAFEIYGSNLLHEIHTSSMNQETVTFTLNSPGDANKAYVLALSLGCRGMKLGKKWINLTVDSFFFVSVTGMIPTFLSKNIGFLDGKGRATAVLNWPRNFPPLGGLTMYAAWVSYDSTGIISISETEHFVLP